MVTRIGEVIKRTGTPINRAVMRVPRWSRSKTPTLRSVFLTRCVHEDGESDDLRSSSSYRSFTHAKLLRFKHPRAGAHACRVALSATVDPPCRNRQDGLICTRTRKKIMPGSCLVDLLTNLMPRARGEIPRLVICILKCQDPAAAKTWGRQEAAVLGYLG